MRFAIPGRLKSCLLGAVLTGVLGALASPAAAGLIVAAGDTTPSFYLSGASQPGNQQFFTNLLGDGDTVLHLNTAFSGQSLVNSNLFYDNLPGVSSSIELGPVTDAVLAGVDLLVVLSPDDLPDQAGLDAVRDFLLADGTLYISGEGESIGVPTPFGALSNANANALLAGIGSDLRIVNASEDFGQQFAEGSQIQADPLTTGVTRFQ